MSLKVLYQAYDTELDLLVYNKVIPALQNKYNFELLSSGKEQKFIALENLSPDAKQIFRDLVYEEWNEINCAINEFIELYEFLDFVRFDRKEFNPLFINYIKKNCYKKDESFDLILYKRKFDNFPLDKYYNLSLPAKEEFRDIAYGIEKEICCDKESFTALVELLDNINYKTICGNSVKYINRYFFNNRKDETFIINTVHFHRNYRLLPGYHKDNDVEYKINLYNLLNNEPRNIGDIKHLHALQLNSTKDKREIYLENWKTNQHLDSFVEYCGLFFDNDRLDIIQSKEKLYQNWLKYKHGNSLESYANWLNDSFSTPLELYLEDWKENCNLDSLEWYVRYCKCSKDKETYTKILEENKN